MEKYKTASDIAKEINIQTPMVYYYIKKFKFKPDIIFKNMKLYTPKKAKDITNKIKSNINNYLDYRGFCKWFIIGMPSTCKALKKEVDCEGKLHHCMIESDEEWDRHRKELSYAKQERDK